MNAAAAITAHVATPDWAAIRAQFPILSRDIHGKPLIYFDSANTSQKPASVIDTVDVFYRRHNANVSRAVHTLGSEATDAYEGARKRLAAFLKVRPDDLVLTSGPKRGQKFHRISANFLRKLGPDGKDSDLRCVRRVINNFPAKDCSAAAGSEQAARCGVNDPVRG